MMRFVRARIAFLILLAVAVYRVAMAGGYDVCSIKNREEFRFPIKQVDQFTSALRKEAINNVESFLPSPLSDLLLGMVIGVDGFDKLPNFKEALRVTGTLHIVVVSGFNISLVFNMFIRLLGSKYRLKNMLIAQIGTVFYAILSGFEPPVVRALIMGSIVSWGTFYGRRIDGGPALIIALLIILSVTPCTLYSLSFQLSAMASLGLIYLSEPVGRFIKHIFVSENVLTIDLTSTLSAQLAVLPLLAYTFGNISVIGVVVNPLILWAVPLITIIGSVIIITSLVSGLLAHAVSYLCMPFVLLLYRLVCFSVIFPHSVLSIKFNLFHVIIAYAVVFFVFVLTVKRLNVEI